MAQVTRGIGLLTLSLTLSCSPVSGPDKSVAGAVLGASWGAGAGAVIGNQMNDTGPGAMLGAALGAGSGLAQGIALDVAEGAELQQQREIDALKVQVASNDRSLMKLQDSFERRGAMVRPTASNFAIFFDSNRASLRLGSATQLERLAEAIKGDPTIKEIEVHGHSDDVGDTDTNNRLSEARARTIKTFLSEHGISVSQITTVAHGATQPLTSNATEVGKQRNRRAEVVILR